VKKIRRQQVQQGASSSRLRALAKVGLLNWPDTRGNTGPMGREAPLGA
jgi:hypothetical protein